MRCYSHWLSKVPLLIISACSHDKPKELVEVSATSLETTLTLASAHALVLLEDGIVGDPMEKTALESLKWKVQKGDIVAPDLEVDAKGGKTSAHKAQIHIKRRFQFSSALKRMSTVSTVNLQQANTKKRTFVAVKGAPETLRTMYNSVPSDYESTYKWFAQRGSRVLALGYRWMDNVQESQVS